ncbi:hypothetical protein [Prochlorococcus sp. MIT 1307]|uniref:hypothetical protein n=1 Tax=Prochlorococcus sp. MIT 1307 TaxID=3096219 RepID=UPI002A74A865|nr:hypothetical protein [Prochlorococcus sp. MIT 1307]
MNYQMLLECHAAGTAITKKEAELLDLELDSQIASIKVSRTQGCIEVAPDHICKSALVCKGSFWITCFASVLDQINPVSMGTKARGARVFDELVNNGYVVTD